MRTSCHSKKTRILQLLWKHEQHSDSWQDSERTVTKKTYAP